MRPIRFRAWDNSRKEMLYPQKAEDMTDKITSASLLAAYNDGGLDAIMQSTGLKDKNGKEIWEGDIIKHYMGDTLQTNPSEVCWNDDGGWSPWLECAGDNYTRVSQAEIIGNIYENPELIK
jgi:hypothetical protein